MATILSTLPSGFGFVAAVAVAGIFVLQYMGATVGAARKKYNVPYPYLYADQAVAEKDKGKYVFNCVQRGHQNSLEQFPVFLVVLAIGGLKHPLVSAAGGAIYLAGRVAYHIGYSTGDPAKRSRGFFGYIGLFAMLFSSFSTIYSLLLL